MNQAPSTLNGQRALLADDEQSIRELLRTHLEYLGVEVIEARNGEEALELYTRGPFDLVLTDYAMPKMRGDALAWAIKIVNPAQRVVMVSGFAEQVLKNGKLPVFIDRLIAKPCTIDQLTDAFS